MTHTNHTSEQPPVFSFSLFLFPSISRRKQTDLAHISISEQPAVVSYLGQTAGSTASLSLYSPLWLLDSLRPVL